MSRRSRKAAATEIAAAVPTGPTGPNRTIHLKIDNCSPRAERLITSICELFCSIRQDEWEHLLAGRSALVCDDSGRATIAYSVQMQHLDN